MKRIIFSLLSVVMLVMMMLPADIAMARGPGWHNQTATNVTSHHSSLKSFPKSPLVADFIFYIPACSACSGITFTDKSTGGVKSYKYAWDFGDGSKHSTAQNPRHRYASDGTYNVTLTVTDRAGTVASKSETVTLSPKETIVEPLSSNSSTKGVGSWPRCNDGCTANDATITYAWLEADSSCTPGEDNTAELWATFDVNRAKGPWCVVSVMDIYIDGVLTYDEYTTAIGDLPGSGQWDRKIGDITWPCGSELELKNIHVQWMINDGTCGEDCTGYHPSKCWDTPGPFIVHTPLVANFEFNNVCFCNNTTFTDTTTGGAEPYTSWYWAFGDGSNSTAQNPKHHYASTGTYNVTLTVTDHDGATDSQSHDVTVHPRPSVNLTGDTTFCGGNETTITASVTGGTPPYTYDWSDSTAPGTPNDGSYTATGSGTVEVTVTDDNGCTDSDYLTVTAVEDCDALDYYDAWEYYCVDGEVWMHRMFHDIS
jgi:PKD repeat protein